MLQRNERSHTCRLRVLWTIEVVVAAIGRLGCHSLFLLDVVDLLIDEFGHLLTEVDELAGLLSKYFVLAFECAQEQVFEEVLDVLEVAFVVVSSDAFANLRNEIAVSDEALAELLGVVEELQDIVEHAVEVVHECVVVLLHSREHR